MRHRVPPSAPANHHYLITFWTKVYLAEDSTLLRKVELKLPAEFTCDADRVRRFQPEARSALNYPNILRFPHLLDHRR